MRPYTLITEARDLSQVAEAVSSSRVIGLDIECCKKTGGPASDPREGLIRLVQLSIDGPDSIYLIDLFQTRTLGPLKKLLASDQHITIIQNAKFEQKWFWHHYGIRLWPVFCTFRASALIYNGKDFENHLYALYKRELGLDPELPDMGASDWSGTLTKTQLDYAAEDVSHLHALRIKLREKLVKYGLLNAAMIEFGVVFSEGCVELNGFNIDQDKWRGVARRNQVKVAEHRTALLEKLPHPKGQIALPGFLPSWNVNSPAQVKDSLKRLGIEGVESTSKTALSVLAIKHPVVMDILEFRHYEQLVSTFGESWLRWVSPDGRIHSEFWGLLATGRYSCVASWTKIKTKRGLVPISEIAVGDYVWTHKGRWRKVLDVFTKGTDRMYDVRFLSGETLTCTSKHRLLTRTENWISIGGLIGTNDFVFYPKCDLYSGEGANGHERIQYIQYRDKFEVYDLAVEEDESYEACGVFSHNSSKPNLQQVPRDKEFRSCFTAPPGKRLVVADYGAIEMRLVAQLSGDPKLIYIFTDGDGDPHRATAALMLNKDPKAITKKDRQQAKPVNFGLAYGMTAPKLVLYALVQYQVRMSEKQAVTFRKRFFSADRGYAGIARWHDRVMRDGMRLRCSRSPSGRLRYLDPKTSYNEFKNSPIQSAGADGLKRALAIVHDNALKYGDSIKIVNHVHDEIILEIDDDDELDREARKLLEDGMKEGMSPFLTRVPVAVDANSGYSWADAK
jgi:DNA polymerase I-like protein with 3'-5' exonuclease and polymerase domains